MKKLSTITLAFIFGCLLTSAALAQQGKKCFFASDCPKGFGCVTPKGEMNGTCQPNSTMDDSVNTVATAADGTAVKSIIGDEGRCTFNTDCPNGGQCVKEAGTLYGKCQGTGYGTQINPSLLDQKRTCFFDQDCKPGQRCSKPQGSFKGTCEDDFFQSNPGDAKDPKTLLQNQFRTSNKRCLQDGDCGIRESCIVQDRSVFGICTPKDLVGVATLNPSSTLFPSSSSTNDLFKF